MDLFAKLVSVLQQGTLPVMVPLVVICLGIGILIVDRVLYLYDPRLLWTWVFPPARRRLRAHRAQIGRALEAFVNEPTRHNQRRLLDDCRRYQTPYSRFLERAMLEDLLGAQPETLDLFLERALLHEEQGIERGFQLLSTFARAAPLLGLLGTVSGMIQTFSAMMVSSTGDPKALSAGISVALIATNVGLMVGLPGVIGMGFLSRRGQTQQEEIRLASMRLRGLAPLG
ncbi:MAG: MotA/TolQ/ExbB proton channel family protein [Planctomycetota bacterium]